MHETMVAQSLLTMVLSEAEKQNARPIDAKISCGMLSAVNDEILIFAFDAIAKDTICEGMKIQIEHKNMQGKCRDCQEVFELELSRPKCPKCDSVSFELLPDAPLVLEQIEFQTE